MYDDIKPTTTGFYKYQERHGDPVQIVQVSRTSKGSLKAMTKEGEVFLVAHIGGVWSYGQVSRPADWNDNA